MPATINDDLATELVVLEAMSDSEIDYSDIPQQLDWSDAVVGEFYRPLKQQVSIRIDKDVVAWFKAQGQKGYATRMGQALREYVQAKNAITTRNRDTDRKTKKNNKHTGRKLRAG